MTRFPKTLIAATLLAVFWLPGCAGMAESDLKSHAEISRCGDAINDGSATVKVTNKGSETADYEVAVAMVSNDGSTQLGVVPVQFSALGPGQSTQQAVYIGTPSGSMEGKWHCQIQDVQRLAR